MAQDCLRGRRQVLAVAGGFNYRAIQDYVSITRSGPDGRAQEFRGRRESILQPGDQNRKRIL